VEAYLDDKPAYEAFSYAWESQTLDRTILCEGKTAGYKNCEAALHRLKQKRRSRNLKIDSI
jgi:hypothetical protein